MAKKIINIGLLIGIISIAILFLYKPKEFLFFNNYGIYLLLFFAIIVGYNIGYLRGLRNNKYSKKINSIPNKKLTSNPSKKSGQKNKCFQEIDTIIKDEKLYLNPDLNLSLLSDKFDLSIDYISQLINEFTEDNFSNYINHLRIKHVKNLLKENEYHNYTIITIAMESGFNSKSAFYRAFKKETNISSNKFSKNKFVSIL